MKKKEDRKINLLQIKRDLRDLSTDALCELSLYPDSGKPIGKNISDKHGTGHMNMDWIDIKK